MHVTEGGPIGRSVHRELRFELRTSAIGCCKEIARSGCRWQILSVILISLVYGPKVPAEELVNNLHFPGHYYDEESGLYYNWNRYYNPKTGTYISSDPIGLAGGRNIYQYAASNPVRNFDPFGLYVVGRWIGYPVINVVDAAVDKWNFIPPSISEWGYLQAIRLHGHADGYINVDVECFDECSEWEVHERVFVTANGYFDVGPNLLALGAGYGGGPYIGVLANILVLGAAVLQAERHYLNLVERKAAPIVETILSDGPTQMCLVSQRL